MEVQKPNIFNHKKFPWAIGITGLILLWIYERAFPNQHVILIFAIPMMLIGIILQFTRADAEELEKIKKRYVIIFTIFLIFAAAVFFYCFGDKIF